MGAVERGAGGALLADAQKDLPLLLRQMEQLVRLESPSDDKARCEQALELVAGWAREMGGVVRWYRSRTHADSLEVRWAGPRLRGTAGGARQRPVLLLGHLDTVWPVGTLARMPFRVGRERIQGPGVLDMKAGVAMALAAMRLLLAGGAAGRPVTLLLHGDEEIGSPASRAVTERVAPACEAVYVLEPGQGPEGALKTARKGVGHYRLEVSGVGSHSGVDFEAGHSAVLELAHQLLTIASFTEPASGLTVNPGVIGGGTLSNVVAASAWAEIDVRIAKAADAGRIERKLRSLRVKDKACQLEVSGGINRPPMERTRAIGTLFAKARAVAAEMGIELHEASTGGGSDGNFTAAMGVPTLDGMGAVGGGAHAASEHVVRGELAPRVALLAGMLR
ncbi:M20 family peptidase [Acidipila sp. EB88]|nr:M20 family peptidase [Acidipila sp. EB88]